MGIKLERNIMVPMRDGVRLATDVWVPEETPSPALLVRIPYGKSGSYGFVMDPHFLGLLEGGYALIIQDCRGRFGSEGSFYPAVDDGDDGADTIAWLRDQPWCDGRVGMWGASYVGFGQFQTASRAPEGLMAIAPRVTSSDIYSAGYYSDGGALSWHMFFVWSTMMTLTAAQQGVERPQIGFSPVQGEATGHADPATLGTLAGMLGNPTPHLEAGPGSQELLVKHCPWYSDYLQHAAPDDFWQRIAVVDRLQQVTVPALHIGGWFDLFVNNTARTFTRMHAEAGTQDARSGQRLIIGPWEHAGGAPGGAFHDRQFGPAGDAASVDWTGEHLRFFDRWIKGKTDALDGVAPVRIFVMGIDRWRDEQDWPLPDTTYVDYYLDGAGQANSADGDGVLSTDAPSAEATDTYTYDPADPVPSVGGRVILLTTSVNGVGPVDQRAVEARPDVLCFSTPVLTEPVEVTGHISLVLHITSNALDTDFTAKLLDVFPDGRAIYLTDGILRARYRHSLAEPQLLEPSQVHELTLDLSVTSNAFLPGHRIRLEVSSSCFPRYDRNTNTGGAINTETLEDALVATNQVLHGPAHPSRLVLPVIRR
jgi:putative CocE/NonD family hydrolase